MNRVECWVAGADGLRPAWRLADGGVTADFERVTLGQYRRFHHAVRFSPDGQILAVVATHHDPEKELALLLVDADTGAVRSELGTLPFAVGLGLRFTPDGSRVIAWTERWADTWDAAGGGRVARVTPPGRAYFRGLAVHPAGRHVMTVGHDARVRVWDLAPLTETHSFAWGVGKLHSLALSPDGLLAAAGGDSGKIVVWDVDL